MERDWLGLRPRRAAAWQQEADRCVVLRPRFGSGPLGRWLAARARHAHYRIRLDEIGTLVWLASDGATPAADIAAALRERFGDRIEPAEARLGAFIERLHRARVIEFGCPDEPKGSYYRRSTRL